MAIRSSCTRLPSRIRRAERAGDTHPYARDPRSIGEQCRIEACRAIRHVSALKGAPARAANGALSLTEVVTPMPAPSYSLRALARLALSLKAAQVAEQATDLVPTLGDEWLPSGALLDEARRLVLAAEAVLQRAVTVERESGTSWAEVGRKLGLAEQEARERFAANTQAWVDGVESLMQPMEGSIEVPLLPGDGVESPDQHARRLDRWMAERDGEQGDESCQVSDGLEVAPLNEQLYRLAHVARRFGGEDDLMQRRAYQEAEAALLDMAARLHPSDERAARRADESSLTLLALRPTQAKA